MMRALIVDDEMHAREELASLLAGDRRLRAGGHLRRRGERAAGDPHPGGPTCSSSTSRCRPSPASSSSSMIDDAELPRVVFVTAHDEYALRAFEENAVDYLLKPVSRERLGRTVERLRHRAGRPRGRRPLRSAIRRIPCQSGQAIKLLDAAEIEFARSSEAGVYVVCPKGEFFTELTLRVLEERAGLVRCHKQYLVRLDRVEEVRLGEGGGDAPDPLGEGRPGEPTPPAGDPGATGHLTRRSPREFRRSPLPADRSPGSRCGRACNGGCACGIPSRIPRPRRTPPGGARQWSGPRSTLP